MGQFEIDFMFDFNNIHNLYPEPVLLEMYLIGLM